MFEDHNDTIFEIIKSSELLDDSQLDEINESHLQTGKPLAEAVIDSGLVERGQILSLVADYLGLECADSTPERVPEQIAAIVKPSVARMYAIVPLESDTASVKVLAKDPFNASIIDDLTFTLNKDIHVIV